MSVRINGDRVAPGRLVFGMVVIAHQGASLAHQDGLCVVPVTPGQLVVAGGQVQLPALAAVLVEQDGASVANELYQLGSKTSN